MTYINSPTPSQHANPTPWKPEKTYKDLELQFSNLTDKNAESARRYEESVRKYLNEYHEQIQNAVRNTFGEFDSKLKDFAQSMTEAVVNLTDAVEELNTKNTKW